MKNISKILITVLSIILFSSSSQAVNKILSIGDNDSKVTVKVFSSLTCPHCAHFHENIFYNLKKEFISQNKVKFEHHSFPLDLAALNAEIIVRCHIDNEKKFQLLSEIYKKQNQWAVGSDIKKINKLLKEIGLNSNLKNDKMNECLNNDKMQDQILNERINSQKEYKISSTPTIIVNGKKYEGQNVYKDFKKIIDKNL